MSEFIEVVAGVLRDQHGRVLLAQRVPGSEHAGLWEFPGGKRKPAETANDALRRELDEELGIRIGKCELLLSVPWRYPNKNVRMDVLNVLSFSGTPHGHEGQALAWVAAADLPSWPMPAADLPAACVVDLPREYVISADPAADADVLLTAARSILRRGVSLLQLRAPSLPSGALLQVADTLMSEAPHSRIVLNADPAVVQPLEHLGVHLNSARLHAQRQRPLPRGRIVAASCHSPDELAHAVAIGCDFVTLSPVLHTDTHPHAPAIGWEGLGAMIANLPIAVFALGGVAPQDLARARGAGAFGVAGIRGFVR